MKRSPYGKILTAWVECIVYYKVIIVLLIKTYRKYQILGLVLLMYIKINSIVHQTYIYHFDDLSVESNVPNVSLAIFIKCRVTVMHDAAVDVSVHIFVMIAYYIYGPMKPTD